MKLLISVSTRSDPSKWQRFSTTWLWARKWWRRSQFLDTERAFSKLYTQSTCFVYYGTDVLVSLKMQKHKHQDSSVNCFRGGCQHWELNLSGTVNRSVPILTGIINLSRFKETKKSHCVDLIIILFLFEALYGAFYETSTFHESRVYPWLLPSV